MLRAVHGRLNITSVIPLFILILQVSGSGRQPGDHLFDVPAVHTVELHFAYPDFIDSLYASHDPSRYIPVGLTLNGENYGTVGIRFKGFSSFYGYPGDKKSMRIDVNEFNRDVRVDGLKKFSLNNGWNDPTFVREKLHLDLLAAEGIPAPRANFARVYINEGYWGFFTLVEHVDKTFLESRYEEDSGNLYKADRADLVWKGPDQSAYYEDFELKTNEKENDWRDLVEMIRVLNEADPPTITGTLPNVLDVQSFIRVWAMDMLLLNLDSYIGSATNYYLYHAQYKSAFTWIVWDVNLTLGARGGSPKQDIFYRSPGRPLIDRMLGADEYRRAFIRQLSAFTDHYFRQEYLSPKIDQLVRLIDTDYSADTLKMYSNEQAELNITEPVDGVPGLKPFIRERRQAVLRQLDELSDSPLIINEIQLAEVPYLELFNRSDSLLPLAGWHLSDGIVSGFPAGDRLPAGDFVVITADRAAFADRYGMIEHLYQWKSERIEPDSPLIALYGPGGQVRDVIDAVGLAEAFPNAHEHALMLIDPEQDNDNPANWHHGENGGTPGRDNDSAVSSMIGSGESEKQPTDILLHPNYPNPFNPTTTISFELPTAADIRIRIVDVSGRRILEKTGSFGRGPNEVILDMSGFASGIYFYGIESSLPDGSSFFTGLRKMVLIK